MITRSSLSISSHSAWEMASRMVMTAMTDLAFLINVLVKGFRRGIGAGLGERDGLLHLLLHLGLLRAQQFVPKEALAEQVIAEDADRVVLLPALHFLALAVAFRIPHGMPAVAVGQHLQEEWTAVITHVGQGFFSGLA